MFNETLLNIFLLTVLTFQFEYDPFVKNAVGWALIGLVTLNLFTLIIIVFYNVFIEIRQRCRACRQKTKTFEKVKQQPGRSPSKNNLIYEESKGEQSANTNVFDKNLSLYNTLN